MVRASLSAVIVAHDSLADLRSSLPALVSQLGPDDEIILVDNGSQDGLRTEFLGLAPGARLIEAGRNLGFAAGVNLGAESAHGDLIVMLNPDAVVRPGWSDAIRAPWGGVWAAWMGLVLLGDGTHINTSGGVLHFTGFGWSGQFGAPVSDAPSEPTDVAFLSGACLAIPRATWQSLGGFPEQFFMYCEDVDLSLKLRLGGGRLAVIPGAVVVHEYAFSKGRQKWRLLERNRWATVIRTYPTRLLTLVLPAMLLAEPAVWAVAIRGHWARMKALATLDLIMMSPRLFRERAAIQATREVDAATFAGALTGALSSPYFGALGQNPAVTRALSGYWRVACAALRPRP